MAAGADLAARLRAELAPLGAVEKKMFGGTCFMLDGNMVAGTFGPDLLVRTGKDGYAAALAQPHAGPMKMGARTMQGFVVIAAAGIRTPAALRKRLDGAIAFVQTMPARPAKSAIAKPRR